MSDYGNHKTTLSFSTGKLNNGYAVTFLGSHTKGPGYIDATAVNSWAWFLTISKQINDRQSLGFYTGWVHQRDMARGPTVLHTRSTNYMEISIIQTGVS